MPCGTRGVFGARRMVEDWVVLHPCLSFDPWTGSTPEPRWAAPYRIESAVDVHNSWQQNDPLSATKSELVVFAPAVRACRSDVDTAYCRSHARIHTLQLHASFICVEQLCAECRSCPVEAISCRKEGTTGGVATSTLDSRWSAPGETPLLNIGDVREEV